MQFPDTARTCQEGNFLAEYVQIKVKTIIKRLNDVKRQTNYLVCNIEGTEGTEDFKLFTRTYMRMCTQSVPRKPLSPMSLCPQCKHTREVGLFYRVDGKSVH